MESRAAPESESVSVSVKDYAWALQSDLASAMPVLSGRRLALTHLYGIAADLLSRSHYRS
jgi:hypothetical protein